MQAERKTVIKLKRTSEAHPTRLHNRPLLQNNPPQHNIHYTSNSKEGLIPSFFVRESS